MRLFTKRVKNSRVRFIKSLVALCVFILVWQIIAFFVDSRIFPTPVKVFLCIPLAWKNAAIHSVFSIYRIFAGVLFALIAGIPLGIWLGYGKRAGELLSPLLYLLAPIPKIALLPLIMLMFGIGDISKIFIIFIIMVFQVVTSVRDAVKAIPEEYFIPLNTIKADTIQVIKHIVFPAVLPSVFSSIRVGLATSVSVLFFAETFGTRWGLGFYVMDMWMQLKYTQMYLGIVILGVIGYSLTAAADFLERKCCPWGGGDTHNIEL